MLRIDPDVRTGLCAERAARCSGAHRSERGEPTAPFAVAWKAVQDGIRLACMVRCSHCVVSSHGRTLQSSVALSHDAGCDRRLSLLCTSDEYLSGACIRLYIALVISSIRASKHPKSPCTDTPAASCRPWWTSKRIIESTLSNVSTNVPLYTGLRSRCTQVAVGCVQPLKCSGDPRGNAVRR